MAKNISKVETSQLQFTLCILYKSRCVKKHGGRSDIWTVDLRFLKQSSTK